MSASRRRRDVVAQLARAGPRRGTQAAAPRRRRRVARRRAARRGCGSAAARVGPGQLPGRARRHRPGRGAARAACSPRCRPSPRFERELEAGPTSARRARRRRSAPTGSTCSAPARPSSGPRSTGTPTSRPAAAGRSPRLAAADRLRRRLGHQGAVGALALPAPAAARGRPPADRRARATSTRSAPSSTRWIDANPVEFGPNWACTMDVAIRAANWVAALALVRGGRRRRALVRARARQPAPPRPLHPLAPRVTARCAATTTSSDVVGLLAGGRPLLRRPGGPGWARAGRRGELVAEMEHQVRPDGCDARGVDPVPPARRPSCSSAATQAADALVPGRLPDWLPRATRLDARLRPRLHAARRARAADRRRRRRPLPAARRLRAPRPPRPPPPLRPGRPRVRRRPATSRRLPGRRLLRAARRATCTRSSAAATPAATAAEATPTTTSSRSSSSSASSRSSSTRAPTSTPPIPESAEPLPLDRGTTRRCGSAAPSRTSCAPTTSSPWRTARRPRPCPGTRGASRAGTGDIPRRIELAGGELRITDTVESAGGQELEWTFPLEPGAGARDPRGRARLPRRGRVALAELRGASADDVPARAPARASRPRRAGARPQSAFLTRRQ